MSAHGMPKTLPPLLRKESHLRARLCSPSAQAEGCSRLLWTCQLPTPTSGSTSENEGPFLILLVLEQGRKFIYSSNSCWSSLTAFYSLLLCHREEITRRTQFNPYWSNLATSPDKNCCQNKKNKENQVHMLLQPQAWAMNTPLGISKEKKEVLWLPQSCSFHGRSRHAFSKHARWKPSTGYQKLMWRY